MIKIGIIGAGAAGLCALKHILSKKGFVPIIWEHSSEVGGTWIYTSNIGTDKHGFPIHSSMYNSLKTNLPKEIMAFPDFPFREGEKSFIHHTDVLQYLNDYTDHFGLRHLINFEHHVDWVEPVERENGPPGWKVSVRNLVEKKSSEEECDALIICNGHYSTPKYPDIINMDSFSGKKMHSHSYRVPDPFSNMTVAVLGASASGMDISLELAKVAKKVYLCHNFPLPIPSELPANLRQAKGIKEARPGGFLLHDGSFIEADAIVFCTGYEYTFPFLSPSCGVTVKDSRVRPLYKHLVHTKFPSMAMVGIPFQICPFPIFDMQVRFFLNVLSGAMPLPSRQEMDADTASELERKVCDGKPLRYFHKLGQAQWAYTDLLAEHARVTPLDPVVGAIYLDAHLIRHRALTTYKENNYVITGPSTFESSLGPVPKGEI